MSLSIDIAKPQGTIPTAQYDVVVMGAGPYGLSTAAHLLARGLKVAVFGKPIQFWSEHMPQGMLLRSHWWASNLSDPRGLYSIDRYCQAQENKAPHDPLPIETFINYGLWFQQQAVPDVDETYVTSIERREGQYLVTLADGRLVQCAVVVMAPGLLYYAYRPQEYAHLPSELASHSADHSMLKSFAGKRVIMVGAGQAALETSALLHEEGAEVQLVTRHPIRWLREEISSVPQFIRTLRAPKAGMGNGWMNLLLEKYPYTFQRFPQSSRDYVLTTRHGPAGSVWLKPRVLGKVEVHEQERLVKAEETENGVRLKLTSGKVLEADHVMLATGYRANIKRLPMLSPSLLAEIQTYEGSPILSSWFESNIPGLYFVGFSAARIFGPFYRFVVGSEAAARRVAASVARKIGTRGRVKARS
jgi:cation diffusion facilitator CzcD-associated flavoprotein CzcO